MVFRSCHFRHACLLTLLPLVGCVSGVDEEGNPLYPFEVILTGDGSGSVVSGDGQINCPADCFGDYHDGEDVTLTATPAAGSSLVSWLPNCDRVGPGGLTDLVITVRVSQLHGECTARFDASSGADTALTVVNPLAFHGHPEHTRLLSLTRAVLAAETPPVGEFEGRLGIVKLNDYTNLQYEYDDAFCSGIRRIVPGSLGGGLGDGFYALNPGSATVCSTTDPPGSTGVSVGIAWADGVEVPGTSELVFTDFNPGTIIRFNPETGTATWSSPLVTGERTCPFSMAMNAGGTQAWAVGREGEVGTSTENCNNHRGIWRIELATGSVSGYAALGPKPRELALTATADYAYVSDYEEGNVRKVDLLTMTVVGTLAVGMNPVGIDLSPDGTHLAVADWGANRFRIIDLPSGEEIATVDAPYPRPSGVQWLDDEFLLGVMFGLPAPPPAGTLGGVATLKLQL